MTPEQIEKERQAFEVWIHPTKNDPEDLLEWSDCGGYVHSRIRDYWRAWLARANQPAWIRAEDRLPPHGENVVFVYSNPEDLIDPEEDVYSDELFADVGYCNHKHFGFVGAELLIPREDVLYWQPLPTPPKGAGNA